MNKIQFKAHADMSRRRFLRDSALAGAAALALPHAMPAAEKQIQGFEQASVDPDVHKGWVPVSDRKIRVGIVGYGASKFGGIRFSEPPECRRRRGQ